MKDVKFDKKALVAAAKDKELPKKTVASFRFTKIIYDNFRIACKKEKVSRSAILEEFMRTFASK